jgi:hypothetical protein
MRRKVRLCCGLDETDPDWSDDVLDSDYLNPSFWEIQNKFNFKEQEQTVKFYTLAGQAAYEIPKPFNSLISLSVQNPSTNEHMTLQKIDVDLYERQLDDDTWEQGLPEYYTHENCFVRLLRVPDIGNGTSTGYLMILKRRIALTDLSNTNQQTSIPDAWHEPIVLGAQFRVFGDLGDPVRMTAYSNIQARLLNTMVPVDIKEKQVNTERAAVQPYRPEYKV